MGRKERPLDPSDGPVQAFAAELRKLRVAAGLPTYDAMAAKAHVAKTILSEAAGGDQPPTWTATRAYLTAVGVVDDAELASWHDRWSQMRADVAKASGLQWPDPASPGSDPDTDSAGEPPTTTPRFVSRRTRLLLAAIGVAAALILGPVLGFNTTRSPAAHPAPSLGIAPSVVGVLVQNKVAVGESALIEDSTPAYLSATPRPYCAKAGCKIPDTEMWSGEIINVTCIVDGAWMTNFNLDSSEAKTNPNRYASSRWYRGQRRTGGEPGFLAEVYIAPEFRGGLGLPICPAVPT